MENPPNSFMVKYRVPSRWGENFPWRFLFVDPGASKQCHMIRSNRLMPLLEEKMNSLESLTWPVSKRAPKELQGEYFFSEPFFNPTAEFCQTSLLCSEKSMQQINVPPITLGEGLVGWWEVLGLEAYWIHVQITYQNEGMSPKKGTNLSRKWIIRNWFSSSNFINFQGLWLLDWFVSVATATCYPATMLVPETFTKKNKGNAWLFQVAHCKSLPWENGCLTKQLNKRWLVGVLDSQVAIQLCG